jgi:hypothetical protein
MGSIAAMIERHRSKLTATKAADKLAEVFVVDKQKDNEVEF